MTYKFLSIVIPCYNEERNIRLGALEQVAHFMSKKNYPYEVIIVDDFSTDQSRELIKDFLRDHQHFSLIENKHTGKAGTVMKGIQMARGKYILFTDLDQATPINQIDKLLPFFENNYDVVIGSRQSHRRGAPLLRKTLALGFMTLRNIILNINISDTQCGFKAFKREAAKSIFSKLIVYKENNEISGSTVTAGFDVEILFIAKRLGFRIAEVPVDWHYQETRRVNPLKDSIDGLKDLVKIKLNQIKGYYR